MNTQSFSGNTATQTTGTVPVTPISFLLNEQNTKELEAEELDLAPAELQSDYEEFINLKEEQLLDLQTELPADVKPVEVLQEEPDVVSKSTLKKHIYNIYPAMFSEDYLALKNDIQNNGYDSKYPIWLFNGEILDGWNRQIVCDELKIVPTYETFNGTDEEAFWFVVRSNERRHLTPQQKACIAADAVPVIKKIRKQVEEGKAEKNRIAAINQHRGSVQKLTHPPVDKNSNRTDTKLALIFGTNRTYINQAIKLKKENPEKFEKIKDGEETIKKTNVGLILKKVKEKTIMPGGMKKDNYINKYIGFNGKLAAAEFFEELNKKKFKNRAEALAEFKKVDKIAFDEQNEWGIYRVYIDIAMKNLKRNKRHD